MAGGKANKNQTAVERAAATAVSSGKSCTKCGKDIAVKDLLNVVQRDVASNSKKAFAYHRTCYGT